jgi:hypothetical protein
MRRLERSPAKKQAGTFRPVARTKRPESGKEPRMPRKSESPVKLREYPKVTKKVGKSPPQYPDYEE